MEKYSSISLCQLPPYYSHLLHHWIKEASLLTVDFQELLQDNECLSFPATASDEAVSPCLYAFSSDDKNRDYSTPSLGSENSLSLTDCLALLKTGVSRQGDEAGINKPTVTETYGIYKCDYLVCLLVFTTIPSIMFSLHSPLFLNLHSKFK